MGYRASRVDRNQTEIVRALRAVGAKVQILSEVGRGCPDLMVAWKGKIYLLEVKDGLLPPSERRLTPAQVLWHRDWQRQADVHVVLDTQQALAVLGVSLLV